MTEARRVGIASFAFVVVWLAATLVARWLVGSSNVLAWIIAAVVGVVVYAYLRSTGGAR